MSKQKAGIACDDYKVPTFEKELEKAGFEYKTVKGIIKGTKTIQVEFDAQQMNKLKTLVNSVELGFKGQKN